MTPEQKQWIDNATYAELLSKWWFAPIGDPYFQFECGRYYATRMETKRMELKPGEEDEIFERHWSLVHLFSSTSDILWLVRTGAPGPSR